MAAILSQLLILKNQRHIIHAPLHRQPQCAALFIFQQDQARQPLRHLMPGFAVQMGVIPAGCGGLIGGKGDLTRAARGYRRLRSAIHRARDFQPVPVQRGRFAEPVMNVHRHRLAALQPQ